MQKFHLKIIRFTFLIFTLSEASKPDTKDENFELAKRSLLEREREFFRSQPMSADLRSFIEKYKPKNQEKRQEKREKRSGEIDENLLYVVQNGQLVPFKNMKGYKRSEEDQKNQVQDSYTVVPLVIPLKAPEVKLVKTRTLDDVMQSLQANEKPPPPPAPAPINPVPQSVSTLAPLSSKPAETENEPTPANLEEEQNNDNNTKDEQQVLHRILEDVEGLMQWKHEGSKKEGVICNLNGSWISDAAGMRFDICYKNSTRKKFRIHVADRIPPNEDGFLCDGNWTVFGELPFQHSGMVIALAVHEKDKHIATFIGECRICDGSETVTGTWLIGRSSRDCKDQKAAHKILSDVWKREQGHTLRKKHLQEIGYSVADED